MKLFIFVIFAMLAAAFATDLGGQAQAVGGWVAGAGAVIGGGALGKSQNHHSISRTFYWTYI